MIGFFKRNEAGVAKRIPRSDSEVEQDDLIRAREEMKLVSQERGREGVLGAGQNLKHPKLRIFIRKHQDGPHTRCLLRIRLARYCFDM